MSKLKPFNLEQALAGKPVVRNKVGTNEYTPIVKVLHFPTNTGHNQFLVFYQVHKNITCEWLGDDYARAALFMAPEKKTLHYVSMPPENGEANGLIRTVSNMWESEKLLRENTGDWWFGEGHIIHTIEIEL